jgi:hypothetical protein
MTAIGAWVGQGAEPGVRVGAGGREGDWRSHDPGESSRVKIILILHLIRGAEIHVRRACHTV